jgi:DNA ligase-1
MSLRSVHDKLEQIASFPGRLDKEATINRYQKDELFQKVVYYALNPFMRFNISSLQFSPNPDKYKEYKNVKSIFDMLDYLASKKGATDAEREFLEVISSIDRYTLDVVSKIVSKDLKCGANIRTFRKFFPEIPIHEVMLCIKEPDKFIKHVNGNISGTSCYSIKKDGVRCWVVHNLKSNKITYLSRSGIEFPNFSTAFDDDINKLTRLILQKNPELKQNSKIIYDSEVDAGKTKTFQKLMTQIRKIEGVDPQIFKLHIFDIVLENIPFIQRYKILYDTMLSAGFSKTHLLEHWQVPTWVKTSEDLVKLTQQYIDQGEEGIVVKVNSSPYEFKRSNNWFKIKKFHTIDVRVLGWEYGSGKNSQIIGNLNCVMKNGIKFDVGSGFSDEQRIEYMTETPNIVEVSYQEFTKEGKPRFVTFVRPRDDKVEID